MPHASYGFVSGAGLAVFRALFGGILCLKLVGYLITGYVTAAYLAPERHFTYYGFDWVVAGPWLPWVVGTTAVAAGFVALGFCFRVSSAVLCCGFVYLFLLEQTQYLNHFYLIILLSFLLALVPAHRTFSVDAWLHPSKATPWVPRWAYQVFLAQIAITYGYGAIAKLNVDWLFRAQPVGAWTRESGIEFPGSGHVFAWGGFLFDLLAVPALLWKRTRVAATLASLFFHGMNKYMFNIGAFPLVMMAATTLFFDPSWPISRSARSSSTAQKRPPRGLALVLAIYFAIQLLVPLRHWLYPGNPAWTEEGQTFAWRMKLREKRATVQFEVHDRVSHRTWTVDPAADLTPRQLHKMSSRPHLILQYAHMLAERLRNEGWEQIEVYAHCFASLNGRPRQRLIDPEVDLAVQPRDMAPKAWIVPLHDSRRPDAVPTKKSASPK